MREYDKIGFIGLGVMGFPMARNLLKAGYKLVVYDLDHTKAKQLTSKKNVEIASTPSTVSKNTEVIILMLPNTPHVEEVVYGDNGLEQNMAKGDLLIDMSSISPTASRTMGEYLQKRDVDFIDAPVSGGEIGAIEGTLTIMVGGKKNVLEECKSLLSVLGDKIVYCGTYGAGQVVKVVNQLMSAVNLISMAEGFILGVKGGVKPEIIHEIVSTGSGCSWAVTDRVPAILKRNFKPGFTIDLHTKDIHLALEMAKDLNIPLYATALTKELFTTLQNQGKGEKDNSAIVQLYEQISGVKIEK